MNYFKIFLCLYLISTDAFSQDVVSSIKTGNAVNPNVVLVNNKTLSNVAHVSQPTIMVDDKASKLNQLLNWCGTKSDTDYLVNDEYQLYGYVTSKGLLNENLKNLINAFYPMNQGFIDKTAKHKVASETCILARSKSEVIQKLIEPYRFEKQNILFGNFSNDIAVLFYRNDLEMSKYLKVH
ncbi:hypothetical protein [Pseudoalteromonas sp. SR41-6]|uniref:hypothetical protein n=1 Tax=Pseudoalteromonas sp. SR41-6 TaxID=2760948 RepID=UPI001601B70C|nr:hypothetical protein [Pseudoalteromonas sp. SR41-6]MBB1334005.1 hypothetical protein [Pseudoalteromonas sp. SR41-6]